MRIGSLCTGYGGLDMAAEAVTGGTVAWVSDTDKGSATLLAHRYPGVPNLGDFTGTDWTTVEPVDVLTAGFPCQPVSHAGKRLGDDDERWLWDDVHRAVRDLGPRLVLLENVRGLLTARGGRLFGRVVGTLADIGYDTRWAGVRAADVGAPHGRWRIFIAAYPRGEAGDIGTGLCTDDSSGHRGGQSPRMGGALLPTPTTRDHKGNNQRGDDTCLTGALLPTPRASDGTKGGPNQRGSSGDLMLPSAVALLPTPAVNDMGAGKTVEAWDEWTAKMQAKHGNGNGHGPSLAIEAQRLLPTPSASDGAGGKTSRSGDRKDEPLLGAIDRLLPTPTVTDHKASGSSQPRTETHATGTTLTDATVRQRDRWGDYGPAIHRWEPIIGRPAPDPAQTSTKGNPQLAPPFVEWMMGLPQGWVTDTPGLTRNQMLKLCGNGVVPQQAAAAIRGLLL